jgi:outer membrane protein insertion porin family
MNRACLAAILLTPSLAVAEPTGRFVVGAGFSEDEHFIAHAEVAQDDLFGTGHKLSLAADLSQLRQEFRIAHEAPDLLGTGFDLRTELYSRRRIYDDYSRESVGGAITLGRQLDRATRIYARYRVEHVDIDTAGGVNGEAGAWATRVPLAGRVGNGMYASLGAGIEYSTLDQPFLPTRGTRLELFAEHADPMFGADVKMLKVAARFDHAAPLGPFIARISGRGGYVRSLEYAGVPLAERLPYEGHADLLGYPMGTFGSADLEASGRVELELPIIRRLGISVAGFAEAGLRHNADPQWGPTGMTFARTAGAGLIWRSPIGPLRFDWALPLDGTEREPIFLFTMGAGF